MLTYQIVFRYTIIGTLTNILIMAIFLLFVMTFIYSLAVYYLHVYMIEWLGKIPFTCKLNNVTAKFQMAKKY